ncbi:MAG: 3-succinoylsemialdehyde-pyridine dehydrogenase [Alphaproteobacteria bacterium MarineAlpha9_Bin3]|nr:MAG: 3-succinoylsemialdehyde-pyridine dehydrogenase [Alphaproteobacteria bacterium MarineAlpha9_Bin3]|tara:strand:- start:9257 stop:10693 length:1437 start_codon:yes stop_codon:yes gene_type:complete
MENNKRFYINGEWVDPISPKTLEVINPANEEVISEISMGSEEDVNIAVLAAKNAFSSFSHTSREERLDLFERIMEVYKKRMPDLAKAITSEMGAPVNLANAAQAPAGLGHLSKAYKTLKEYNFEFEMNTTIIRKEPVGVCGLITPWNWPINQIACKVGPALAAGCTMILKPSEVAPLSAIVFTEILDEAGVPKGVYNMINGDGPTVGEAMSKHIDIDMMSFTGSTRAGISVAKSSADTVKRVTQELGGKSANILLDDANFNKAVTKGVMHCMNNSGQSCNAPTRMLVPNSKMEEVIEIAKNALEKIIVGNPESENTTIGPVVSEVQYNKIKNLIEAGIKEGATLVAGGTNAPEGYNKGYYIEPTIFANVTNDMTIAKEEIFGPVLSILGYKDEEDAIKIANETIYGLSGYVSSENIDNAKAVASKLRTGMVHINNAPGDQSAPFGGYKMSGNGREWGEFGLEDFLEIKSVMGAIPKTA